MHVIATGSDPGSITLMPRDPSAVFALGEKVKVRVVGETTCPLRTAPTADPEMQIKGLALKPLPVNVMVAWRPCVTLGGLTFVIGGPGVVIS